MGLVARRRLMLHELEMMHTMRCDAHHVLQPGQGLLACCRLVNMISNTLPAGEPLAAGKASDDGKIGGGPHGGMHDGMGLIACRRLVGLMVIRPG